MNHGRSSAWVACSVVLAMPSLLFVPSTARSVPRSHYGARYRRRAPGLRTDVITTPVTTSCEPAADAREPDAIGLLHDGARAAVHPAARRLRPARGQDQAAGRRHPHDGRAVVR